MNVKKILVTITAILLCSDIFSQDKVAVIINNKMIGETLIPESPVLLTVSKAKYKNVSRLVLKYIPQNAQSPYKRSIEITDAAENPFYFLDEAKGGLYNINLTSIKKNVLAQKVIKIFMNLNPANSKMGMPSRRKFLIELHLK